MGSDGPPECRQFQAGKPLTKNGQSPCVINQTPDSHSKKQKKTERLNPLRPSVNQNDAKTPLGDSRQLLVQVALVAIGHVAMNASGFDCAIQG